MLYIYFILGLILAVIAAIIAPKRNQSAGLWFFLTIIFPIAILFIAMKDVDSEAEKRIKNEEKAFEGDGKNLSFDEMDTSQKIVTISFISLVALAALYAVLNQ
jgi:hypothetical protein